MKRFTFILCIAACAFAACQKEAPIDDIRPIGTQVTATVGSELTKTVLGEKDGTSWPVLWQSGDKIDINGNESAPLGEGGQATAVFSFDTQLEAPYKAAYPASVMTGDGAGELPAVQEYTADSFDAGAGVLLGTGDADGVTFSHAMAYIAFVPVKGELDADIKSLELTATGGEKLSGAFTTDYSTLTLSDGASSKVTVNCTEAVALGNEIIVAVPAQTYSQGFTVKFTDNAGNSMQKSTGASWTAEAGHIYTTTLTYSPVIAVPEALYIAGDAVEWGWNLEVENAKLEGADGVFTKELRLNFGENGNLGFKMFSDKDWGGEFGMRPVSEYGNIHFCLKGYITGVADPQFYLGTLGYESGDYTLTVDFNTMTMTLALNESVEPVVEPFYVFGQGLDCPDWEFDEAYVLNPLGDNVFEGHNIHLYKTSYFKLDRKDWTEYRRDATASDYWTVVKNEDGVPDNGFYMGDDPDLKSGKYTVRLDLNTMKVTLTLTEADPEPESDYPQTMYVVGGAIDPSWGTVIEMTKIEEGKFQAEHVALSFENGDDAKGHGIKFMENSDWSGQYGPKENYETTDYRGWELASYQDSPQFYPLWAGYSSGTYTILADFTTMTVTLTKE